jgi:hypothetical protein
MPGFMSMGSSIGPAVAQEARRMVHFWQPPGPLLLRLSGLQKVQHLPSAGIIMTGLLQLLDSILTAKMLQ